MNRHGLRCGLALLLGILSAAPVFANDTVTYYLTDSLHSVVVELDAQRNVLSTTHYGPYGLLLDRSMRDGPGYGGHEEDPATGLNYMQQRYYDPQAGRFVSSDPVLPTEEGGNFNRYWYANDNPYRYTDPDGRHVTCDANSCTISRGDNIVQLTADLITVGVIITARLVENKLASHSQPTTVHNETHEGSPPLPNIVVGEQDAQSGRKGKDKTHDSGAMAPEYGGTGDAEKDFGKLIGGKYGPAASDSNYPPGTLVGENGISLRPARGDKGPRIDIPANGDKPPETLHYPKPPPPPPPKDGIL